MYCAYTSYNSNAVEVENPELTSFSFIPLRIICCLKEREKSDVE